jgi:hypothetical protein
MAAAAAAAAAANLHDASLTPDAGKTDHSSHVNSLTFTAMKMRLNTKIPEKLSFEIQYIH